MKITYDDEADALYLYLREGVPAARSVVIDDDRVVDVDASGRPVGIEVLGASAGVQLMDLLAKFDLSPLEAHFRQLEATHFGAVEFA